MEKQQKRKYFRKLVSIRLMCSYEEQRKEDTARDQRIDTKTLDYVENNVKEEITAEDLAGIADWW